MRPGALLRASRRVSDGDARVESWPVAHRLLLIGLLALGIALRASCVIRPYWIDEAWVLNSVGSTTLSEMFAYPKGAKRCQVYCASSAGWHVQQEVDLSG